MSDMICASPRNFEGVSFRLPFRIGYVVVERGTNLRATLEDWAMAPVRALRNRGTIAALAAMDARELADIGLTRADVREAAAEGAFGQPMTVLDTRAAERAARP